MILEALYLLTALAVGKAYQLIDLSGDGWTLTSPGNSSVPATPAWVPSENYQPLQAAGVIADPLYGFEEDELAWVRYSNWTYTSKTISGLNRSTNITTKLVFDGLDTYTSIYFCNQQVGTTDNQFLQFIIDITDVLPGCSENDTILAINSGPAQNITHAVGATDTSDSAPYVNLADSCKNGTNNEFACKPWARKEQSDFGWDWSPHLIPAGPWRNISIVQLEADSLYINNAAIDIYRQGQMNNLPPDQSQPWIFNASLDVVGQLAEGSGLSLNLTDSQGNMIWSGPLTGLTSNNMTITGSTVIDSSKVELWWPSSMGSPTLYTAQVTVTSNSTAPSTAPSVIRRVGFRTIVLNLNPVSDADLARGIQPGSNWHFEINGDPFYAKGANMVPLDIFWPRVNLTTVANLFEIALESHFNMFRVWASGAYLDDGIYDLADEMGILLWSEFEFTDAEYPTGPHWEGVYEDEAYYNVRRVNSHPSLALWCGGNELEAVQLAFFFNGTNAGPITYEYEETFLGTLIRSVYANTRSISYIPSSTYHGYLSLDFSSPRPQLPRYLNTSGPEYLYTDTDFYIDPAQAFNQSAYPIGRFAVEFVASPSGSESAGIERMTKAVELYYPYPEIANARANFSAWIWSTQVYQADSYAYGIAIWRRGSGLANRQLGSLYWQFNDVWVAPTFSSITTNLKPKILQYTLMDIYQPVIVRPYYDIDTDDFEIWVTSDQLQAVSGVVEYQWMTWSGEPLPSLQNGSANVVVEPVNSTMVYSSSSMLHTLQTKVNISDVVMRISVSAGNESQFNHSSFYSPVYLANASLQDPGLTLTKSSGNTFTVKATSAVAAWVTLDHSAHQVQGYWSENGFWLCKGEEKTVSFKVWNDWSGDGSWVNGVTVRSMWDNVVDREYAATLST